MALALINQAYALLLRAGQSGGQDAANRVMLETIHCIGTVGMIGGQVADLESKAGYSRASPLASRLRKTSALMRLSMTVGAVSAGASEMNIVALTEFGEQLGYAYQIYDDVLDSLGDKRLAEKNIGQDARHLRQSYAKAMSIEGAYNMAISLVEQGKSIITQRFGESTEIALLVDIGHLLIRRLNYLVNPGLTKKGEEEFSLESLVPEKDTRPLRST